MPLLALQYAVIIYILISVIFSHVTVHPALKCVHVQDIVAVSLHDNYKQYSSCIGFQKGSASLQAQLLNIIIVRNNIFPLSENMQNENTDSIYFYVNIAGCNQELY